MDFDLLIPSKIRRDILGYFVDDPERSAHVRQIARDLSTAPQQVYREVINLERWGLLFSSKEGVMRVFRLNKKFPFWKPITELFSVSRRLKEMPSTFKTVHTFNLREEWERTSKIATPPELIPYLSSPRKKPRAYEETLIFERQAKKKSS